jgi:hypothetical protein
MYFWPNENERLCVVSDKIPLSVGLPDFELLILEQKCTMLNWQFFLLSNRNENFIIFK